MFHPSNHWFVHPIICSKEYKPRNFVIMQYFNSWDYIMSNGEWLKNKEFKGCERKRSWRIIGAIPQFSWRNWGNHDKYQAEEPASGTRFKLGTSWIRRNTKSLLGDIQSQFSFVSGILSNYGIFPTFCPGRSISALCESTWVWLLS
jgi:hypothetical protein